MDQESIDVLFKLFTAMLLGIVLGIERALANKTAGMRTFSLVSIGAALFVIISQVVSSRFVGMTNFDPLRVASQIIVGIGFLGAGLIIYKGPGVVGLTTAAGMWVAAGIGMAVGFGLYLIAVVATLFTLFIFFALWFVEAKIKKYSGCYRSRDNLLENNNENKN
jgi:putative Mg2+ transporter-C (MgtC) family protein